VLIVPFAKKMDWKKPPVITIALVIINTLLFSFWQSDDDAHYEAAIKQYMHSSLPNIEFPRYAEFLGEHRRFKEADDIEKMQRSAESRPIIVIEIQHDAPFLRALANGEIVKKGEADFDRWQQDRQKFEAKFNTIVSETHTFKPAFPEASDAFTHMFMHGSIMHLVGNMVFLVIVGLVVERLIGSGLYLAAYLTGGLIALGFFTLGNSDSAVPLLGASGAIAGMMGMYAAFFGKQKIPFFYSLGFYFDYIRAPAYLLLIAWMGNEAFQLLTEEGSGVAYLAHFGGLVGGGCMGYLATHFKVVDAVELEWHDEQTKFPWQDEYDRAMAMLGRLDTVKAADAFAKLHRQYPNEAIIQLQYYKSAKYQPESDAYHLSTLALLSGAEESGIPTDQVRTIFNDYLKLAKPKPRLNREQLHQLAPYFLKHGYLEEAMRIVAILIRHDGGSERTANLAVNLARQLRLKQQLEDAGKLLKWVLSQHGETAFAAQARTLLQVATESKAD